MSGANPKVSITGNEKSDPFEMISTEPACVTFVGGTGGTVTPQYSNKRGTKIDADWTSDPTPISVSANAGPYMFPFGIAKFIRFVGTAITGTVAISWGPGKDPHGSLIDLGIEAPPPAQVTA